MRCMIEPTLAKAETHTAYQFERLGYFSVDKDSSEQKPTFNRIVGLRDTWAKIQAD